MTIRKARTHDLPAAATLLARSLGFTGADAVPAWFMRTTDECGGLTLVAAERDVVVGVSYAVPAFADGSPCLFSCGLAVAPEYRDRRLGTELKVTQRREALAVGYRTIHWTTDPLNGRALRVYLGRLGAVITGYRAGLHDGLRADPGHPQDDLDIVWHLAGGPALDRGDERTVELPWTPGDDEPAQRRRVRTEMSALLADGYAGCGVELDRGAGRCLVTFARVRS